MYVLFCVFLIHIFNKSYIYFFTLSFFFLFFLFLINLFNKFYLFFFNFFFFFIVEKFYFFNIHFVKCNFLILQKIKAIIKNVTVKKKIYIYK